MQKGTSGSPTTPNTLSLVLLALSFQKIEWAQIESGFPGN